MHSRSEMITGPEVSQHMLLVQRSSNIRGRMRLSFKNQGFGAHTRTIQDHGFGAHIRTIQARHMVRSLLSETLLVGMVESDNKWNNKSIDKHISSAA